MKVFAIKKGAGPLPLFLSLPDDICLFWNFVFQRVYEVHFQNILEKIYISWSWSHYFLGAFKNKSENQAIDNKIKVIVINNNTTPITSWLGMSWFSNVSFLWLSRIFVWVCPLPHFQNRCYGPAKISHLLSLNNVHLKCYADPKSF